MSGITQTCRERSHLSAEPHTRKASRSPGPPQLVGNLETPDLRQIPALHPAEAPEGAGGSHGRIRHRAAANCQRGCSTEAHPPKQTHGVQGPVPGPRSERCRCHAPGAHVNEHLRPLTHSKQRSVIGPEQTECAEDREKLTEPSMCYQQPGAEGTRHCTVAVNVILRSCSFMAQRKASQRQKRAVEKAGKAGGQRPTLGEHGRGNREDNTCSQETLGPLPRPQTVPTPGVWPPQRWPEKKQEGSTVRE